MRVTIDLMKKSTQIIDLSDVINPRVGDDDLLLPLHIVYGDNQTDMRGKDVEFISEDTNKQRIYVGGTCNTDTPGDNLYMGNLTFRFPAGTFKADGTYDPDKTMFQIVDKATNKVISSVNVKITVMKNNIEFDFDPDKSSYDSRAETMLNDFKDKGQAMLDDIKDLNDQAKSNVSGDTAATAKEAKQQADTNAGDISDLKGEIAGARGRYADLPGREDAQDTAINQKESINNANANYAALQQKDAAQDAAISQKESINNANANYATLQQKDDRLDGRQTALTMALQNKLAQIDVNPEFFTDLNALSAKYPNGKEGVFILDNGHTAVYQNGWQDSGHSITVGSFTYRAFIEVTDVTAPYDSLDTLPSNSVLFYAPDVTQKFFELPFAEHHVPVVVITLGADFSSQNNYGRVQRLINRDTGNEYYRNVWVGSDGKMSWNNWFSQSGMQQLGFTGDPLSSPYDDLDTLPNNTVVSYAPLKSLKNNPLNEAIIVKTEGPNIVTNKDYTKIQTLIGQYSGKKYYRTVWIGDNGTGNWTDWHSSDGMQELGFTGDSFSSPYDDLNTLPNNTIVLYAPSKGLKNNPLDESIIVKTEGPNILVNKNYGKIQTLIGQWSGKKYYRTLWIGEDGTGNWSDWHSESIKQEVNYGNGINQEVSLSIFDKVTVIGDSYSAGWLQKPDGSSFYDKSKYQWARLIGKKYGFTVNNLSMSGWTAQDFVKNKLSDISNNELQDAYIIALGINDQSNGKETLGTKDDLKQDYQNNPDSFYGNMGKIIGTIKGHDANARIILLTIMRNDGAVTDTFNAAIKDIAKNYSLPVADLDSDPYFQTDEYEQRKAGGHPTIVGYGALAEHLDNVLQKAILNNYDYFCNTASIFNDTVK